MASHNELGKKGEDAAVEFLKAKQHEILARNFRFHKAEVDIISKAGNIVVFTEVKTRSSEKFGYPEEFVDKKKIRLMKEAAEEFMYQNNFQNEIRFDIISVTNEKGELKIHHIEDAFFYEDDAQQYSDFG